MAIDIVSDAEASTRANSVLGWGYDFYSRFETMAEPIVLNPDASAGAMLAYVHAELWHLNEILKLIQGHEGSAEEVIDMIRHRTVPMENVMLAAMDRIKRLGTIEGVAA